MKEFHQNIQKVESRTIIELIYISDFVRTYLLFSHMPITYTFIVLNLGAKFHLSSILCFSFFVLFFNYL